MKRTYTRTHTRARADIYTGTGKRHMCTQTRLSAQPSTNVSNARDRVLLHQTQHQLLHAQNLLLLLPWHPSIHDALPPCALPIPVVGVRPHSVQHVPPPTGVDSRHCRALFLVLALRCAPTRAFLCKLHRPIALAAETQPTSSGKVFPEGELPAGASCAARRAFVRRWPCASFTVVLLLLLPVAAQLTLQGRESARMRGTAHASALRRADQRTHAHARTPARPHARTPARPRARASAHAHTHTHTRTSVSNHNYAYVSMTHVWLVAELCSELEHMFVSSVQLQRFVLGIP